MEANKGVIVPGRRLGKLAPKIDKRTLRLARYVRGVTLPTKVPKRHVLSKKTLAAFPNGLGMMGNDVHSDCTCAAAGHIFQTLTTYGGLAWQPTDSEILEAYGKINGGADNGANMLDACNLFVKDGIGGHKIGAFAAFGPKDWHLVQTALYLFGNVYVGAALPVNAQHQDVWDYVAENGNEPGSWGGHAFNIIDTLGDKAANIVTWGEVKKITRAWYEAYVDEAYCFIDESWLGPDKKSPQGFRLQQLLDDLTALRQ